MNAAPPSPGVTLNDLPVALEGRATLLSLLSARGLADRKGVAAAVNGDVVPRAAWEGRALAAGDRVLVIRATQGG
jgi:sulfur carrier protein